MIHVSEAAAADPTTTYRSKDSVDAARELDVDLVIASDGPDVTSSELPDNPLTLPLSEPASVVTEIGRFAEGRPLDAGMAVDDFTTLALGQPWGDRLARPERARREYRRDPGGKPHE